MVYLSVTKYRPIDLLYNNKDIISDDVKGNMIKNQSRKKKLNPIFIDTKVFICEYYHKNRNILSLKFQKKGKYLILGTVIGNGLGATYPIRFDMN